MTRISSFCISLSAAALLAAALPGPAQSQTLTGLRITDVATGRDFQSTVSPDSENFTINTGLDLFRPTRSSEDTLGRRFIRRLLDVTITSDGSANAPFTDLVVRGNGVYRGRLGNGQRVAGTVSGFGSAAFSNPDAETYVSGTYTEQRGSDTIEISYETDREAGGWRQILRQMLYMESVYESARYGGGTEVLGERDPIITSSAAEHINRGTNITGRNANLLSADLRVYINDEDVVAANPPLSCTGLECSVQATIPSMFDSEMDAFVPGEAAETFPVLSASHFVPTDTGNAGEEGFVAADDKVDVVQSHQGIHLALDRSGSNVLESPLAFGAWMDDAGFFVATRRTLLDSSQTVVAVGERTGSAPDARAVWLGSMVGAVVAGDNQNHLLRGGARLRFNMRRSLLYAEFFNIRDYDRFGAKHTMQEVETGPRNRLRFRRIPVAADGSYARTYSEDEGGGGIRGAFYGTDQAETAGTFERFGIVAAFGAKKLTN